jgi:hypothetical protein
MCAESQMLEGHLPLQDVEPRKDQTWLSNQNDALKITKIFRYYCVVSDDRLFERRGIIFAVFDG